MSGRSFARHLIAWSRRPARREEDRDRRGEAGMPGGEDPEIFGDVPCVPAGLVGREMHGGTLPPDAAAGDSQRREICE